MCLGRWVLRNQHLSVRKRITIHGTIRSLCARHKTLDLLDKVKFNSGSSFEESLQGPKLHTKTHGHWPFGSGKENAFIRYGSHFGHVAYTGVIIIQFHIKIDFKC